MCKADWRGCETVLAAVLFSAVCFLVSNGVSVCKSVTGMLCAMTMMFPSSNHITASLWVPSGDGNVTGPFGGILESSFVSEMTDVSALLAEVDGNCAGE